MKPPTTLHEDAYRRMKAMIVTGELAPGTKLALRSLARQLGTSTMPIIEAVRRLEHDGLVTQVPKWGAYVKEWTDAEKLEAFHIRRALEGEAARLFVLRATEEQKRELVALNKAYDQATERDLVAGFEADARIHIHIARSSGFRRLTQLIELSKIPLTMFWKLRVNVVQLQKSDFIGCHERLVNILRGGDPDLAVQAMWDHVDGTLSLLNGKLLSAGESPSIITPPARIPGQPADQLSLGEHS
ncbi:MAG: GntR family transcriptional regulator [Acidobacteriota bacterium]